MGSYQTLRASRLACTLACLLLETRKDSLV